MSKLIEKIEDEIAFARMVDSFPSEINFRNLQTLRAFKAFVEDAREDLDEESFSEYEQNALAVWEDE